MSDHDEEDGPVSEIVYSDPSAEEPAYSSLASDEEPAVVTVRE